MIRLMRLLAVGTSYRAPVTGTVWDIRIEAGQTVSAGETLIVIEAMKMEISVDASENGTVHRMLCRRGEQIAAGQIVAIIATKLLTFTRGRTTR